MLESNEHIKKKKKKKKKKTVKPGFIEPIHEQ